MLDLCASQMPPASLSRSSLRKRSRCRRLLYQSQISVNWWRQCRNWLLSCGEILRKRPQPYLKCQQKVPERRLVQGANLTLPLPIVTP